MYQPKIQFAPQDPLTEVVCPLCQTSAEDRVLARKGFPYDMPLTNVICQRCGLIRITPRMSERDYERFYQQAFFDYLDPFHRPAYLQEIEGTTRDDVETPTKKLLLPFIEPFVPVGGTVLDVGAGFGQVLYLLRKQKQIRPLGLEPDPGSRKIAQEQIGIELEDDVIERYLPRTQDLYDFVILNQVFEHLLEPLETLTQLAARLKPHGAIFIGVPNAYNPLCSMSLFYQLAHTFNYTPHTLRQFADRAGLKIVRISPIEAGALEVIMTKKEHPHPEVAQDALAYGSSPQDLARRLQRKRMWNIVRGTVKKLLGVIMPTSMIQSLRQWIDRLIGYRY